MLKVNSSGVLTGLVAVGLLSLGAWTVSRENASPESVPPDKAAQYEIGYPKGPWWRSNLNLTRLGVADILIAHEGSVSTNLGVHVITSPGSKRGRDQALYEALKLRQQLYEKPERFEQLAQLHSDDVRTAPFGGVRGSLRAGELPVPFVDALGNLAVGEISRVIETPLGFHILKRLPVAKEERIWSRRIVIAYDGSSIEKTLRLRTDRPLPSRTRHEAEKLAGEVRAELSENTERMDELARLHSDAFDQVDGGFYGARFTYDVLDSDPLVMHHLMRLEPGELSPVIDTEEGFQIFKRLPPEEVSYIAFSPIFILYDTNDGFDPGGVSRTKREAEKRALAAAQHLKRNPAYFDTICSDYNDIKDEQGGPIAWITNGDFVYPGLWRRLNGLEIGETLSQPYELPAGFLLARRERADERPPTPPRPPLLTELERPEAPNIETASTRLLQNLAFELKKVGRQRIDMNAQEEQRFIELMDNLATSIATVRTGERAELVSQADREVLGILGVRRALLLSTIRDEIVANYVGRVVGSRP